MPLALCEDTKIIERPRLIDEIAAPLARRQALLHILSCRPDVSTTPRDTAKSIENARLFVGRRACFNARKRLFEILLRQRQLVLSKVYPASITEEARVLQGSDLGRRRGRNGARRVGEP